MDAGSHVLRLGGVFAARTLTLCKAWALAGSILGIGDVIVHSPVFMPRYSWYAWPGDNWTLAPWVCVTALMLFARDLRLLRISIYISLGTVLDAIINVAIGYWLVFIAQVPSGNGMLASAIVVSMAFVPLVVGASLRCVSL